jgi:hypothetical protein
VPYLRARVGVKMLNSYPQELSTGTNNCGDTPKPTLNIASRLTSLVRWYRAGEPLRRSSAKRYQLTPHLCLLVSALVTMNITTANAYNPNVESYKLYAHMKLGNDKLYRCLVTLWNLESNWNPKSKNPKSSAMGIPQLLKMKETNPYKQIDLGLKYITHHRIYKGDTCKALDRHKRIGHY